MHLSHHAWTPTLEAKRISNFGSEQTSGKLCLGLTSDSGRERRGVVCNPSFPKPGENDREIHSKSQGISSDIQLNELLTCTNGISQPRHIRALPKNKPRNKCS